MLSEGIEDWDAFFLSLCLIQRSNLSQDRLVLADAILIPVLSYAVYLCLLYRNRSRDASRRNRSVDVEWMSKKEQRSLDHQLQHRPSHSQETIKRMSEFAKDSLTLEETK